MCLYSVGNIYDPFIKLFDLWKVVLKCLALQLESNQTSNSEIVMVQHINDEMCVDWPISASYNLLNLPCSHNFN